MRGRNFVFFKFAGSDSCPFFGFVRRSMVIAPPLTAMKLGRSATPEKTVDDLLHLLKGRRELNRIPPPQDQFPSQRTQKARYRMKSLPTTRAGVLTAAGSARRAPSPFPWALLAEVLQRWQWSPLRRGDTSAAHCRRAGNVPAWAARAAEGRDSGPIGR